MRSPVDQRHQTFSSSRLVAIGYLVAALMLIALAVWILIGPVDLPLWKTILFFLFFALFAPLLTFAAIEGLAFAVELGRDAIRLRDSNGWREIPYTRLVRVERRQGYHYYFREFAVFHLQGEETDGIHLPIENAERFWELLRQRTDAPVEFINREGRRSGESS